MCGPCESVNLRSESTAGNVVDTGQNSLSSFTVPQIFGICLAQNLVSDIEAVRASWWVQNEFKYVIIFFFFYTYVNIYTVHFPHKRPIHSPPACWLTHPLFCRRKVHHVIECPLHNFNRGGRKLSWGSAVRSVYAESQQTLLAKHRTNLEDSCVQEGKRTSIFYNLRLKFAGFLSEFPRRHFGFLCRFMTE